MEGLTEHAPAADGGPGAVDDDVVGDPAGGVVLRLGSSRYVVAMADVAEVVAVPALTRIPGAPGWLLGVANWRGRMLPVIDARPLLGASADPLPTSARLIVVADPADAGLTAGLVAEVVQGVYDEPLTDLGPAPPTLGAEAARLVLGQVADGHGPLAVLDVPTLLGLRERVDRRRHGS